MNQPANAIKDVPFIDIDEEEDSGDLSWKELFTSAKQSISEGVEIKVPPSKVRRMPDQPRKFFSKESLARLAVSMKTIGQVVPGLVRALDEPDENGAEYEILDGERRWRAATIAKTDYRALLLQVDNVAIPYIIAAVANFNREGHTATEISDSIGHMRSLKIPMEEVRKVFGFSLVWAHQMYSLQRLTPAVREMLDPNQSKSNILPTTAAIQISKVDPMHQLPLATMFFERKMSMSQLRAKAVALSIESGTYIRTRQLKPHKIRRSFENQSKRSLESLAEIEHLLQEALAAEAVRGLTPAQFADITSRVQKGQQLSATILQTMQKLHG